MQANLGNPDRTVRFIVGILLIVLPILGKLSVTWTWVSVIVGIVLVLTAIFRFCPAYRLLGIRSKPRE